MRYDDLNDPGNGPEYHTGKRCIEPECTNPAGTAWSLYWCAQHNIERMRRLISSPACWHRSSKEQG